ncbi:MAG: MBOAT family protein [Lachnospiraceae bacterium]|nr:MBOAT family protein [Lachnospiraceae bacterium]
MAFVSYRFLALIVILFVVYFAVPKRFQWIVLLAASLVFYASAGYVGLMFILATSVSIYCGAMGLQAISDNNAVYLKANKAEMTKEERGERKKRVQRKMRLVLAAVLLFNFGILCMFKYLHLGNVRFIAMMGSSRLLSVSLAVPLGLSFYTFQSTGYLIDVYWGNVTAERNYFKTLLFISFFPQITQGPISVYEDLSKELFTEHSYSYLNFSRGARRFLWGMFKKMLIADALAPYVNGVFANYGEYPGYIALLAAFGYSVQIYTDFSGYMDMACGISQIFGIKLTENFERPYFAKSVAEYWRRWHISLGVWFKRYLYFPVAMAKWNKKLGKNVSAKSKGFGRNLPAAIALIVTWAATGIWHGSSAGYVVWGLLNGAFIIVSLWTDPVFAGWKKKLKINELAFPWRAAVTIRTFILVTFIKVLPEVGTLRDGLGLWKHAVTKLGIPESFDAIFPDFIDYTQIFNIKLALVFTALLFVTSLLQRKKPLYEYMEKVPWLLRIVIMACVAMVIIGFGFSQSGGGGFMYARF